MYPFLFGKIPSYQALLIIAILAAVVLFRVLCTKRKLPNRVYNYYSTAGLVSIFVGILSAFLFQAIYDYAETGVFELSGLTFMGGLVGGVITFVLFALLAKDKRIRSAFFPVAELAAPCITAAHAIGRIGCFLSGCCYGVQSEHGLDFPGIGKVIPTQLYEAIFLILLTTVLLYFILSDKVTGYNLTLYAIAYAVFRFVIEFFRGDERGAFLGALSPSQIQSFILLAAGVCLLVLRIKKPSLFAPLYEESPTNQKTE
jgi:phosphatidylglycerol:prolipoprotein diacylglycerol transferase